VNGVGELVSETYSEIRMKWIKEKAAKLEENARVQGDRQAYHAAFYNATRLWTRWRDGCSNCGEPQGWHVDTKCLFGASNWKARYG
jgi:hypothetical protein